MFHKIVEKIIQTVYSIIIYYKNFDREEIVKHEQFMGYRRFYCQQI